MPTQQQIANKKIVFWKKHWNYYVYFHQNDKISRTGPWSEQIALSLRNDLLINNICAWISKLDDTQQ
jgi:hypothetical protein